MTTRIAINGVGRIGRALVRVAERRGSPEVVALNDLVPLQQAAHLLRHDSTLGAFGTPIEPGADGLLIGGRWVAYGRSTAPGDVQWGDTTPSTVVEATGRFTARDQAADHLHDGVSRVVISANSPDTDALVCFGVNHRQLTGSEEVISASSCTTNCAAAVVHPILGHLGVRRLMLMTVHCYNAGQSLVDSAQPDLRRARAAGLNLIPTTTGASWAVERVLPELAGRISGYAVRVPVAQVSLVDLVIETEKSVTRKELLDLLRAAAAGELEGILAVNDQPLVSSDFVGTRESAVVDAEFVHAEGRRLRLLAWYDNEVGYANRLLDLVSYLEKLEP